MSAGGEVEVTCPHCGARFTVPATASRVTCPYCFSVFTIQGVQPEEEHYYFPLDESLDPFERLLKFVSRQYGVPLDLRSNFAVSRRDLHWVPVYFFFGDYKAKASGYSRVYGEQTSEITETGLVSIPASGTELDSVLERYPFSIRGKLPFTPEITSKGRFFNPTISRSDAERKADSMFMYKIRLEAAESFSSLQSLVVVQKKLEYRGLVHYPIWILEYTYKGRPFRAMVDGASGVVIRTEYPQTAKGRISLAAYSSLTLLLGLAGGLAYAWLVNGGFLAVIGGLAVGAAAALPAFTRSATLVASASEYTEFR
ncbi:MAG: hypothetical protein ABWK01_07825 [Infirmifilum sp.]